MTTALAQQRIRTSEMGPGSEFWTNEPADSGLARDALQQVS